MNGDRLEQLDLGVFRRFRCNYHLQRYTLVDKGVTYVYINVYGDDKARIYSISHPGGDLYMPRPAVMCYNEACKRLKERGLT